jgi:exopolysaccharide biosynthesis polyprenyl glycosylphosphotransferase
VSSLHPDGVEVVDAPRLKLAPPPPPPLPEASRRALAHGRVWMLIGADLVSLGMGLVLTYSLAQALAPPAVIGPEWLLPPLAFAASLVWLVVFACYRLYEPQTRSIATSSFDEIAHLFHALLAGSLLFLLAAQALRRVTDISVFTPIEAVLFLSTMLVLVPVVRSAVRTWLLPTVIHPRRALIVGAGSAGQTVARKIGAHPEYGLAVIGFVDDEPYDGDAPLLGRTAELTDLVDELEIDWVILAFSRAPYERMLDLVRGVRRPDVHVSIVPNFYELFASNATIEDIEGVPVVSLPPMSLSRSVRILKRTFDVVASAAGLIVLSPLLAVTALAIKLDSRGPVFFRQARHGRGGRHFRMIKFRTMVHDAERRRFEIADLNEISGPIFKVKEDPRITRVGGVLRKWSIDELPQLWNVLRGEMSLVGPRPFVVHESEQIEGWASRRLETTPGITGLWQVLGRNDIPFEEMVKLDYVYVTNWSLWWDIKILCQTIPVVLARRGAY